MTTIRVYDETANLLEEIAEKYDMSVYELVDEILDQLDEDDLDSMLK